ncbi:CU044_5270 family protein [Streptomyces sp. UNOC14_S4]|uniref:CU044_5270 family protein n=1 Tax=Streptomyces sp. UNOC14_S4 TaxID=2872340 RepID=UPI001E4FFB26|nr:CU044_5270 family protein [Streptomyces sp. UNOC14_S4]MCC3769175.1 CU044_5270 family protein [Streptomyces sp. UNOC14_S4]
MMRTPWRQGEPLDHSGFGLLLPSPGEPVMPPARQSLLKEHFMNEICSAAPAPAVRRRGLRRPVWVAVPAAAALAAGVVVAAPWEQGGRDDGVRVSGRPSPEAAEPQVVELEAGTTKGLSAAVERISLAASRQPLLEPRPDQFIYVESRVSFLRSESSVGKEKNWITPLHIRRLWISPDGAKGYLYEPGHGFLDRTGEDLDKAETDGRHSYNNVKALPADPDALLKRLYQDGRKGDPDADWMAFKEIGSLLQEQVAPPQTSAALYKTAARIPGVKLVGDTTDAGGRRGIAIAFDNGGHRKEWIFDKNTYTYLGQREILLKEAYGMKPGTVIGQTTVVTRAVVDAKKELPTGDKA